MKTGKVFTCIVSFFVVVNFYMVNPAQGSPNIIIVPTDYISIQDAINAASPGDTIFVLEGNYHEKLILTKNITIIGVDKSNTTIEGSGIGDVIYIQGCTVTLSNITIRNSGTNSIDASIKLKNANKCYFDNLSVSNSYNGIYAISSINLTINSVASSQNNYGINFFSSSYNYIYNCDISNNYREGFYSQASHENLLSNNTFTNNIQKGITLRACFKNTIYENYIYNSKEGLSISISKNNVLINNTIKNNLIGINADSSLDNLFYHNHLSFNYQYNARDNGINHWDNGYPSGGNYWSNFDDSNEGAYDLYNGPNQNLLGDDGIVDTTYWIPGGFNKDKYPLMPPPVKITSEFFPRTINRKSNGNWITCYIEIPIEYSYSLSEINLSSIRLNGCLINFTPIKFGDFDNDGIEDLMLKFKRNDITSNLTEGLRTPLVVTGAFYDQQKLKGIDFVKVI